MAPRYHRVVEGGSLELVEGDITLLEVDAVVNPANSALKLGGGVAGAIRRRGGPTVQEECDRIGVCPEGGARATSGGRLPARYVIHAVGPVWGRQGPAESDRLLASACRDALARASEKGLQSIALPAISSGIFGFPMDRAARILLGEAVRHLESGAPPRRVIFCLLGEEALERYREALEAALPL
ncbi:MAG: macro domain-containing protein [Acidobacteriia bacterium]|nr:macro domain-containing protein [Terriglobia bacterium]